MYLISNKTLASRIVVGLLAAMLLAGCAGTQSRNTDPENDPWEGFNRKVHSFNSGLDKAIARPVAKAYKKVTPSNAKTTAKGR
jgi:phospholipid-binding lipoprotein MlaA